MSTHSIVLHEWNAGDTINVNKEIHVNHPVKRVEVSCIANCQREVAADRDDDVVYASLKIRSNLPFFQADGLCPFFTNGVWSPKLTFHPAPDTNINGSYNFQVVDFEGTLQGVPNEGATTLLISFYA